MKGQSRPRSRARSPVPPTPKWQAIRRSDGSDKSKDGKGSSGKGGCKDKHEHTGKGKTKTTPNGLKLVLTHRGWEPAPECENRRHEISCMGAHHSCKLRYIGPNPKWRWEGDDSQSGDDSVAANASTKCPSGLDPTLTCPWTPDSEPE